MGGLKAEYNHKEENKMAKKSKKYVEALNKIDRTRLYDATEALSLVAEVATAKFDETVEAHIKLGVDSRHADQQVRGAVVLPHGLGRVLGPKGLMPNPKSGTVTFDVAKAIDEIKAGKVEYRLDKTNIIHVPVGKVSFGGEKLAENFAALMDAIVKAKPAAAKGQYLRSVTVASTMGPGVKINPAKIAE